MFNVKKKREKAGVRVDELAEERRQEERLTRYFDATGNARF